MRQWKCECGKAWAFGTDAPRACQVCSTCGTTMLRNADGTRVPKEEHQWKQRYSSDTGKPTHEYCVNCHERKGG